jgi:hypothetical protein
VVPCGESEGGGPIHCSSMGGAWQDDGEAPGGRQRAGDGGGGWWSATLVKQRKRTCGGGLKGGPVWVRAIMGLVAGAGQVNSAIFY